MQFKKSVASKTWTQLYIGSSATIIIIAGMAKCISSLGSAPVLLENDPIFGLSFKFVFCLVGIIELLTSGYCLFGKKLRIKIYLVAWLSTAFGLYRFGLLLIDYKKPCVCLGNLTDVLHIAPGTADSVMMGIFAYLLIGSYALLFSLFRRGSSMPPVSLKTIQVSLK